MNLFQNIMSKLFGSAKDDKSGAVPGAMGRLLASMGIHELGPFQSRGIPPSVLGGCKPELVLLPGMSKPAYTKEGKPVLAKNKAGRTYHVTENYAVTRKQWKQMVNDQKRKEAGRWYSGKKAA